MKIVAVTSCPVGMAHTYMAEAALKDAAKKNGVEIKVETQGISGISNAITKTDIKEADAAILTKDVAIEQGERFDGILTYKTTTSKIIKNGDEIIKETIALIDQNRSGLK
jgi:fructose-specific phosphotransferase system IIB component